MIKLPTHLIARLPNHQIAKLSFFTVPWEKNSIEFTQMDSRSKKRNKKIGGTLFWGSPRLELIDPVHLEINGTKKVFPFLLKNCTNQQNMMGTV